MSAVLYSYSHMLITVNGSRVHSVLEKSLKMLEF